MSLPFYRALEEKHRGSRGEIQSRLSVYLPYLQPLLAKYGHLPVFDMGCGRGEWLELLGQHRILASGADLDAGMLEACRQRGLDVSQTDALAFLASRPDHSLLALTGFHIAEHLTFDQLQAVFAEARRVLHPEGLLILETPNPENLTVGSSSFYLDPTHQRPLPIGLMQFLAEYHGFDQVAVLRLQEEARLQVEGTLVLYDVLAGVSPDYALLARPESSEITIPAFDTLRGVSLYELATRYEQQIQRRFQQFGIQLEMLQQLQQQHTARLQAITNSWSWRMTRPLRALRHLLRRATQYFRNRP